MDLPNALAALKNDSDDKISIIDAWQIAEEERMETYYNNKLDECETDIRLNNEMANEMMTIIRDYHISQMTPSITEFVEMASDLRGILSEVLNGAELSSYAGEVDQIVERIDQLVDDAKKTLNTVKDILENAFHALCISLGVIAASCHAYCGAVVAAVCEVSAFAAKVLIEEALEETEETLNEIADTAETPEIDASTTNTAGGVDSSEVDSGGDDYEPTESGAAEDYPIDAGNTQQTNTGEDVSFIDGFNISVYTVFLQFTNVWLIVSFIDLIIIYRRIIAIIARIVMFQKGVKVVENSDYFVSNNIRTKWEERIVKIKKFFGFAGHIKDWIFEDLLPLAFFCIGFYLVIDVTQDFFEIDTVTNLGLYQIFTLPVIAKQSTTNAILINKQDSYNNQLLPQLASSMTTNIQTLSDTLTQFNIDQQLNVTIYNDAKCAYQFEIASYIDTYYCFEKYYGTKSSTDSCGGCSYDLKAMCMASGDFLGKEKVGDNYEVSEAKMSERRKYCEFDNSNSKITWRTDDDGDANTTTVTPDIYNTYTLKCPDEFIINSIKFSGDGHTASSSNWNGVNEDYSYISLNSGGLTWWAGDATCQNNLNSHLVSIHSYEQQQFLNNIVSGPAWIGFQRYDNCGGGFDCFYWSDGSDSDYNGFSTSPGEPSSGGEGATIYNWYGNTWWNDGRHDDSFQITCWNPNVLFQGHELTSGLSQSIESLDCVQANRGPFLSCQTFEFDIDFGINENDVRYFDCTNAASQSGFGDDAAWFVNGFVFSDDSGTMSSLTGLHCCIVPGTVYLQTTDIIPGGYANIDARASSSEYSSTDTIYRFGIRGLYHGWKDSIRSFVFDGIQDYTSIGCNLGDATWCQTNRINYVNYYIEHEDNDAAEKIIIDPLINTKVFECGDGCDPDITTECASEYYEDKLNNNDEPNPFVQKYECTNINFTEAIIEKYHQCRTYPLFAALFYDYDSELHRIMIVNQLTPYTNAIGDCVIRLLNTFLIWFLIKFVFYPAYFKITESLASSCCDAIRLRKVVEVDVATKRKQSDFNIDATQLRVGNDSSPQWKE